MSGENLTNIPPVALLQDLTVQSTLGIESVERNGYYYFAGASMLSEGGQRELVDTHGDLFAMTQRLAQGEYPAGIFGHQLYSLSSLWVRPKFPFG